MTKTDIETLRGLVENRKWLALLESIGGQTDGSAYIDLFTNLESDWR